MHPTALIIKFPGTNCDAETQSALAQAGFEASVLPGALLSTTALEKAQLVVLAGGFSYGDYVMSGRIARLAAESRLGDELRYFVERGGYALGICNGFQILTQLGLLPAGSLIHNTSGRFICRWARLQKHGSSPYLDGLPDDFELPVAHAEGRFVTAEPSEATNYIASGRAALLYKDDINGSASRIAGLQDETGRVFGLMPHPERFTSPHQHYDRDWSAAPQGWGHYLFNSVHAALTA